jgi:hypothetical protein
MNVPKTLLIPWHNADMVPGLKTRILRHERFKRRTAAWAALQLIRKFYPWRLKRETAA